MALLAPEPSSPTKRSRSISQDVSRKRLRHSLDSSNKHEFSGSSDISELQVNELLSILEAEANANIHKVTVLLRQLKEAIEELPSRKPLSPIECEATLRTTANIRIPFPVPPPKDAQYTLEYSKPATVNVIGSTASKTLLSRNGQVVADLVVVMPKELFQEKDFRSYRYFHKKAYYTACIAAGIQNASSLPKLSYGFSAQNGNPLQPCLIAKQSADSGTSIAVRILCVGPENLFASRKLHPWINSLSLGPNDVINGESQSNDSHFYNSTLRAESLTLTYLSLIHKTNRETPSFRKASLLFSVWLSQRGLGTDLFHGGFGAFEAQALMAVMLRNDPSHGEIAMFRTRYNHHQLFKATLILLSGRDFVKDPALYNFFVDGSAKGNNSQPLQPAEKDIIHGDAALFFDGMRGHNLFFKICPWAYARLQRQAEITIKLLNGGGPHKFEHCFISKLDNVMTRYDQVMNITLDASAKHNAHANVALERTMDISKSLYRTLGQALTDRVLEISFTCEHLEDWPTSSGRPRSRKSLRLEIVADARNASRSQDLGPPVDDKNAAAAFRQFWGPKAELRRFRDGSIQESVLWSESHSENIITQILRYVLDRHHGFKSTTSVQEIGDSFWSEIRQSSQSKTLTTFEGMLKSFQDLEQIIRGLKMPLTIRQISPAAPGLRYSHMNIDQAQTLHPMHIVIQFESSGQWPDDLGAVQQVKIAFLQKLGDLLSQHEGSIQTRIGLNSQTNNMFVRPFLEVMFQNSCYHIVLYHDRELVLLRKSPVDRLEDRSLVMPEIHYHNTMFIRSPAHTSRIRDLCRKYPLLSHSIRLFKTWCSAHLLLPHFREELLELFVVHIFTETGAYGPPSSLRTAFLRVITMLSKWDWHNEPLFVSLSDEPGEQAIGQLNTHFDAWRKIDPTFSKRAFIVGSTIDPTGTAWTEQGPSKMIAARLIALAKAATSMVRKLDLELEARQLFTNNLQDYDFVIHLNTKVIRRAGMVSSNIVNNYIEELQQAFGNTIVWFHSGDSQDVLAGLWNPIVESAKWKVNLGYSTRPMALKVANDGDVDMDSVPEIARNTKGTLNEIVRLGGDLVSKVTIKEDVS